MKKEFVKCANCDKRFIPTPQQKHHYKYRGDNPFCSERCKYEFRGHVCGGHHGTCKICGKDFVSKRADKIYCSIECYHADPQTQKRLKEMAPFALAAALKVDVSDLPETIETECTECKKPMQIKPSRLNPSGHVFCSTQCYRHFLSKRFDRWIASPESINHPQNFDEFMTQEELPCLIEGCNWTGKFLGAHVNMAHGISANDFKKLAGFNVTTGLVSPDLAEELRERSKDYGNFLLPNYVDTSKKRGSYVSAESKEHRKKILILRMNDPAERAGTCEGCGKDFIYKSVGGPRKYCSRACRNKHYAKKYQRKEKV